MIEHYAPANVPKFTELLKVPHSDRLPNLAAKIGFSEMGKILMVEITKFQECYNVIRPMSAGQIAQCALSLIQSAKEDWLALEDLVIFFEGAKQGKYGKILDRLDQQTIFQMLEQYRADRHRTYHEWKYEADVQLKTVPINDTVKDLFGKDDRELHREATRMWMKNKRDEN